VAAHGRYNLLRKIADGGTAEVFLAHMEGSAGFKRLVVLKRVRPALWADENFRRGLVDEAHIAMGLHHGNIVQVIDLGVAAQRYFLAFELVDGWTLSQILKRAKAANLPMPLSLVLYVMTEVCRGLSYAHSKTENGVPLAIVHRDVSPQNVLVSEQGEVKLTDFGIARARTRSNTSEIGSVKGKPAFMSPEQAAGHALDARSDLFPIGTMIYLMATGELPFTAPTALEEMARVVNGKFASPSTLRPDLPKELVALINKTLERKPEKRFQSAEELLHAIEKVQRSVLDPAGTTELKAYLGALAKKDGELPLSRQGESTPVPIEPTNTDPIELQDEDILISSQQLPIHVVEPAPKRKAGLIAAVLLFGLVGAAVALPLGRRVVESAPTPVVEVPDAGLQGAVVEPPPKLVAITDDARVVEVADAAVEVSADEGTSPPPLPPLAIETTPETKPVVLASPKSVETAEDKVSVLVESEPAGAQVRIDRKVFGLTPVPIRLKVGIAFELVVSKPGYREQKVLHFVTKRTQQKVRVALVKN